MQVVDGDSLNAQDDFWRAVTAVVRSDGDIVVHHCKSDWEIPFKTDNTRLRKYPIKN